MPTQPTAPVKAASAQECDGAGDSHEWREGKPQCYRHDETRRGNQQSGRHAAKRPACEQASQEVSTPGQHIDEPDLARR